MRVGTSRLPQGYRGHECAWERGPGGGLCGQGEGVGGSIRCLRTEKELYFHQKGNVQIKGGRIRALSWEHTAEQRRLERMRVRKFAHS